MKKNTIILIVVGVIVVVLLGGGCATYNNMVGLDESAEQSWANVQSAYQRRLDLIPNLVNTVKGYAKHESSTLTAVTDARAGYGPAAVAAAGDSLEAAGKAVQNPVGAPGTPPSAAAYDRLDRAMSVYVNAVHEAYPDLKANQNFIGLQDELAGTENRINTERTRYNEAVKEYNVAIRTFPNSMFAGMFGFKARQPFAASAEAQSAPTVNFD